MNGVPLGVGIQRALAGEVRIAVHAMILDITQVEAVTVGSPGRTVEEVRSETLAIIALQLCPFNVRSQLRMLLPLRGTAIDLFSARFAGMDDRAKPFVGEPPSWILFFRSGPMKSRRMQHTYIMSVSAHRGTAGIAVALLFTGPRVIGLQLDVGHELFMCPGAEIARFLSWLSMS